MVERFDPTQGTEGHYVRYSDYAALERQIAELRAKETLAQGVASAVQERAKRNRVAAEAENARLKALPLKDEVERVLKQIADGMEITLHTGGRAWVDRDDAGEMARSLLSRLQAGEREGWQTIGYARAIDVDPAERPFEGKTSFWVSERQTPYYSVPVYLPAAPKQGEAKEVVGLDEYEGTITDPVERHVADRRSRP